MFLFPSLKCTITHYAIKGLLYTPQNIMSFQTCMCKEQTQFEVTENAKFVTIFASKSCAYSNMLQESAL